MSHQLPVPEIATSRRLFLSARHQSPFRPARIVGLGILALTFAAMSYVGRFASDLPNTDEWDFADVLTAPLSVSWLIQHHNEHRYPLGRLIWYASVRASGDFRAPMFVFVALLGLASWFLTDAAKRIRGTASLGDLLVPASLLHWGHTFNFLMGYQVAFGLFALGLAGVAWASVARRGHLGGLFAVLAVQSGGFGLAAALPLTVLLLVNGLRGPRSQWLWAGIPAGYSAWVAATMPTLQLQVEGGPVAGTLRYLAIALGPVILQAGWLGSALAGAAIGLVGLLAVIATRRLDRPVARGLLCTLTAFALSAVAVGYGRGDWSVAYRFVTTSAIGLALAWLPLGRRIGWIGLPLAIALFAGNVRHAVWYGKLCKTQTTQFEADLRGTNLAPLFLAGKHGNAFHILRPSGLPALIPLRDGGWPRFQGVPSDPPFAFVPAQGALPVTLLCSDEAIQQGGSAVPAIPFAALPTPVIGLRMLGDQECCIVRQRLRLCWTDAAGRMQSAEANPAVMPGAFGVTFPVKGIVTNVHLVPATWSAGLRIVSAEWLVGK